MVPVNTMAIGVSWGAPGRGFCTYKYDDPSYAKFIKILS